ncbi:AAA family ATPase [Lactobacillus sp. CC-MHH1034]|uniref:AAA family ATPase n=1 Tax=Agrilactobacillus fermenti TaxID=2586909 RepID=UPI001E36B6CD|nr:AAA family ATPase [Agrilactobacillus fermenti]MCD2255518.1 AAA family ATPase [Agrilactobacillus fermenti]
MNIALIGPHGVGKTVLGKAAAKQTNLRYYSLDAARSQYFTKYGYDPRQAEQYSRQNDMVALFKYWKPFAIKTIEEILPAKDNHLFDLGASFIVSPTPAEIEQLQKVVAANQTVLILMLPSKDLEISKNTLLKQGIYNELTENFLSTYSDLQITDHIFYTHGHTQAENVTRLVKMINDIKQESHNN